MTTTVTEARAMLRLFRQSGWRDLHVRTGDWEIFLAKTGGSANPLRATPEAVAAPDVNLGTVDAPHLGLFHPSVAAGDRIDAGSVVGRLEVLGEMEDIVAAQGGRVAAVLIAGGALVEYATPLVRLAA